MNVRILEVSGNRQHAEYCAGLLYRRWGEGKAGGPAFWRRWVSTSMPGTDNQHFVILADGAPVGTVAIMRCDLKSRQDLSPWIGHLIYDKTTFKNGFFIWHETHAFCVGLARELGFKRVYMYTSYDPKFFQRYGWRFLETDTDRNGETVTILYYELGITN